MKVDLENSGDVPIKIKESKSPFKKLLGDDKNPNKKQEKNRISISNCKPPRIAEISPGTKDLQPLSRQKLEKYLINVLKQNQYLKKNTEYARTQLYDLSLQKDKLQQDYEKKIQHDDNLIKKQVSKNCRSASKIEQLKKQQKNFANTITQLKEQNEDLTLKFYDQKTETNCLNRQKITLTKQLNEIKAQNQVLAKLLNGTNTQNKGLARQLNETKIQKKGLAKQLSDTKAQNQVLAKQLNETKKQNQKLVQGHSTLKSIFFMMKLILAALIVLLVFEIVKL